MGFLVVVVVKSMIGEGLIWNGWEMVHTVGVAWNVLLASSSFCSQSKSRGGLLQHEYWAD
jgi:hypothetical protein